jgi:hypothetical protein
MLFMFSSEEYIDMLFVYGFFSGNATDSVEEYWQQFPQRRIPDRHVFSQVHQHLRESGSFPGVLLTAEHPV